MDNKEIEIKFQIDDIDRIKTKIIGAGGKQGVESFQRTIRLDTPESDLEKRGVFLRVRKEGFDTMTVKIKNKNRHFFERDEYEIKIEDADKAALMLKTIGFSKEKILEKYRTEFKFKDLGVKILLDKLPFGNYIEIEGSPEEIEDMIKKLELDSQKRIVGSYWDIWAEFSKIHRIKEENIVFE